MYKAEIFLLVLPTLRTPLIGSSTLPQNEKMRFEFTKVFLKSYKKAPLKIQSSFHKRLKLFMIDTYHPMIRNHKLTGKYQNYRSMNITGDWRAIFTVNHDGETVTFSVIGTHSQLYK